MDCGSFAMVTVFCLSSFTATTFTLYPPINWSCVLNAQHNYECRHAVSCICMLEDVAEPLR